jgi:hypothetical protein
MDEAEGATLDAARVIGEGESFDHAHRMIWKCQNVAKLG